MLIAHHLYTFCGEDNGAFIQTGSLKFKRQIKITVTAAQTISGGQQTV